jgi:hypothetical protein
VHVLTSLPYIRYLRFILYNLYVLICLYTYIIIVIYTLAIINRLHGKTTPSTLGLSLYDRFSPLIYCLLHIGIASALHYLRHYSFIYALGDGILA